jgi:hypothetical protein
MALLGFALLTDASIPLLVIISFSLGMAETVFDNSSQASSEHRGHLDLEPRTVGSRRPDRPNRSWAAARCVPSVSRWPAVLPRCRAVRHRCGIVLTCGNFRPAIRIGQPPSAKTLLRTALVVPAPLLRSLAIALGVMNLVGMAAMTSRVTRRMCSTSPTQFGLLLTVEAAGGCGSTRHHTGRLRRHCLEPRGRGLGRIAVGARVVGPTGAVAPLAIGGFGGLVWNVLTVSM